MPLGLRVIQSGENLALADAGRAQCLSRCSVRLFVPAKPPTRTTVFWSTFLSTHLIWRGSGIAFVVTSVLHALLQSAVEDDFLCASGWRAADFVGDIKSGYYAPFRTEGRTHGRTECILATVTTNQVPSPVYCSWHRDKYFPVRFRSRVDGPLPVASRDRSAIVLPEVNPNEWRTQSPGLVDQDAEPSHPDFLLF